MLKHLLTTTALVAILATPAMADNHKMNKTDQSAETKQEMQVKDANQASIDRIGENELLASELIGMEIYTSTNEDAEEIATIDDILMNDDGTVNAFILSTGAFFGLGGDHYAVAADRVEITRNQDGEIWLTSDIQAAELENSPVFMAERSTDDVESTSSVAAADKVEQSVNEAQNKATGAMAEKQDQKAKQEMAMNEKAAMPVDANSYSQVDYQTISADKLLELDVIGSNNEVVGDVNDVLLTSEGKIEAMVIDVGGFLGLGEKPVAVAYRDLDIRQNTDGDLVLMTNFTKEKLEGAREYDEASYTEERDAITLDANR